MATHDVAKLRKDDVTVEGPSHEHIIGLVTEAGNYFAKRSVVDGVNDENSWQSSVPGAEGEDPQTCYPKASCCRLPSFTTHADCLENDLDSALPPA